MPEMRHAVTAGTTVMRWLLAGAGLLGAIWIVRQIGWIRLEPTIAEQRKRAFGDLTPRYRQTQPGRRRWWRQATKRKTA